jgi:hypothetical protein
MDITELIAKKVSYQKNAWSKLEKELTIKETLEIIKRGDLKDETNVLREFLKKSEFEKYDAFKKRLPGVTFCATFNQNRRLDAIKDYNYVMIIDIDKLSSGEMARVKKVFLNDDYVFSYWESPSKNGIKGLIYLIYNFPITINQIQDAHRTAFKNISSYFSNNYLIDLDLSGSDSTRLCFLSFDSSLVLKTTCRSFEINPLITENKQTKETPKSKDTAKEIKVRTIKSRFLNPTGRNSPLDRKLMQSIIKYLTKRNLSITYNYEKWYRVAYAISNTFTYDIGEMYYLKLCRLDGNKHDEEQSKYLLYYSYENSKGEINFSTIVYLAKKQGYKEKGGTEGA